MNGRPLAVQWLADSASALVESWFLGVEHGNALADVLFGDVAPSGKLPVTFPRATGQVPIYYAHKNTGRPADPNNHYTSKYLDVPWTPLFPFGHGLSYTTFALRRSASVVVGQSTRATPLDVAVTVTNTGARDGAEVVQLYLRARRRRASRGRCASSSGFAARDAAARRIRAVRFTLAADDMALLRPRHATRRRAGHDHAVGRRQLRRDTRGAPHAGRTDARARSRAAENALAVQGASTASSGSESLGSESVGSESVGSESVGSESMGSESDRL